MIDIRETLLTEHPLEDHFSAYHQDPDAFTNSLRDVLTNFSKSVTLTNKARALVVLIFNKDQERFRSLLSCLDLPEMVKACEILDANRRARQLQSQLSDRLIRQVQKNLVYPTTKHIANFKRRIEEQVSLVEGHFNLTFTSSMIRMIKQWTRSIAADRLEYRAILFPTDQWRRLADLTHLNPTKDFQLPWFLRYCYGAAAPIDSLVARVDTLNLNNFIDRYLQSEAEGYLIPYKIIRLKLNLKKDHHNFTDHTKIDYIKEMVAQYEDLETILWYWSELNTPIVNTILTGRLSKLDTTGIDQLQLSYGKLVELLIKVDHPRLSEQLIALTEWRLQRYEANIEAPVVVLGDASSSMNVAIKTSSIVTSLLCSLTQARLHLFRNRDCPVDPENTPRTIQQAVAFAKRMKASGSTSPASSLDYYYQRRIPVKTFIIITDEEENTTTTGRSQWGFRPNYNNDPLSLNVNPAQGYMFAQLYQKYATEVYPAKLIFISFTNPNSDGQMISDLKRSLGEAYVSEHVDCYKFDVRNPDLNRFDFVLHRMSATN